MVTLAKLNAICKDDPWLMQALIDCKQIDDERIFAKRVRDSISFVVFRPFELALPQWTGKSEYYGYFHSQRSGDGALVTSNPMIVYKYNDSPEYQTAKILESGSETWDCSIRDAMQGWKRGARETRKGITFIAIVKPLQCRSRPHNMFMESYEVFKFPENFDFDSWVERPTYRYQDAPIVRHCVHIVLLQHFRARFHGASLLDKVAAMPAAVKISEVAALFTSLERREKFLRLYFQELYGL